jgi:hypothetical protein
MVAGSGTTLTNWQLRRAMEEAAYVPWTATSRPGGACSTAPRPPSSTGCLGADRLGRADAPTPSTASITEALAQLASAASRTRTKSADTCDFNTAQFELRKAYWDNAALFSDSLFTARTRTSAADPRRETTGGDLPAPPVGVPAGCLPWTCSVRPEQRAAAVALWREAGLTRVERPRADLEGRWPARRRPCWR